MYKSKQRKQISLDSDDESSNTKQSRTNTHQIMDNFAEKKDSETLFDFIKRRKKFAIKQEITKKKKQSPKKQYLQQQRDLEQTERKSYNRTPNKYNMSLTKSPNLSPIKHDSEYMTPRPSISPFKRVTFADSAKPSSRGSRSILEALSPFKRKLQDTTNIKENTYLNNSFNSSFGRPEQKNLQNDKILAKIKTLGQHLEVFTGTAKNYRNKSYSLMTETMALLDQLSQESTGRSSQKKKIGEIRGSFKIIDKQSQELFSLLDNIAVGDIYKMVKERFCSIESKIQSQCREKMRADIDETVQHYESELNQKEKQLDKLRKQMQKLQNKIKKQRNRQKQMLEEKEKQQQKNERDTKNKFREWRQKQNQMLQENKELQEQLDQLKSQLRHIQRENKTLQHQKSSLIKGFEEQRQQVQQSKHKVLIQQIAKLKKKHLQDLEEVQTFNKAKEQKYLDELNRVETMLKEHQQRQKLYSKFEGLNTTQLDALKAQIGRLKVQNDNFKRMILKLEEESFSFWAALKDVKTLSSRLGIFGKFSRIYDDIEFSDVALR